MSVVEQHASTVFFNTYNVALIYIIPSHKYRMHPLSTVYMQSGAIDFGCGSKDWTSGRKKYYVSSPLQPRFGKRLLDRRIEELMKDRAEFVGRKTSFIIV